MTIVSCNMLGLIIFRNQTHRQTILAREGNIDTIGSDQYDFDNVAKESTSKRKGKLKRIWRMLFFFRFYTNKGSSQKLLK